MGVLESGKNWTEFASLVLIINFKDLIQTSASGKRVESFSCNVIA